MPVFVVLHLLLSLPLGLLSFAECSCFGSPRRAKHLTYIEILVVAATESCLIGVAALVVCVVRTILRAAR